MEAALFAFNSPLSKGAILADEVGLGKTIEAGLLLAQKWAERKRRLLVIVPANLRKQWSQELADKFAVAESIVKNSKGDVLLTALRKGFDDARRYGATARCSGRRWCSLNHAARRNACCACSKRPSSPAR